MLNEKRLETIAIFEGIDMAQLLHSSLLHIHDFNIRIIEFQTAEAYGILVTDFKVFGWIIWQDNLGHESFQYQAGLMLVEVNCQSLTPFGCDWSIRLLVLNGNVGCRVCNHHRAFLHCHRYNDSSGSSLDKVP